MIDNQTEKPEEYKFKRPEKIALILAASPLILLFLVNFIVASINGTSGNKECYYQQKYLDLKFDGIVKDKGLDRENHNYPFIDIISSQNMIDHIFLLEKKSELWDKVEVNDSIIKEKESLDFNVVRDNLKFILKPTFNCGPKDFWISCKKHPGLY
jgi:hypothetical protein